MAFKKNRWKRSEVFEMLLNRFVVLLLVPWFGFRVGTIICNCDWSPLRSFLPLILPWSSERSLLPTVVVCYWGQQAWSTAFIWKNTSRKNCDLRFTFIIFWNLLNKNGQCLTNNKHGGKLDSNMEISYIRSFILILTIKPLRCQQLGRHFEHDELFLDRTIVLHCSRNWLLNEHGYSICLLRIKDWEVFCWDAWTMSSLNHWNGWKYY